MSRELRTTLAIMVAVLIVCSPAIFAAPGTTNTNVNYLAMVFHIVPTPTPSPIPTPIPPPLETLTIQLSEMKSGYTLDASQVVTNAQAAQTYKDPKAALKAFQQQGRETSYYVRYLSTDYLFSDAVGVADQVYRYTSAAGAVQGQAYSLAETRRDKPDFRPFNVSTPCCPTVGLRRTFTDNGSTFDQFLISIQVGRYVIDVQSIGLSGSLSVSRAIYYSQLALNHVYETPQTIQFAGDGLLPAALPLSGRREEALKPR